MDHPIAASAGMNGMTSATGVSIGTTILCVCISPRLLRLSMRPPRSSMLRRLRHRALAYSSPSTSARGILVGGPALETAFVQVAASAAARGDRAALRRPGGTPDEKQREVITARRQGSTPSIGETRGAAFISLFISRIPARRTPRKRGRTALRPSAPS